MAILAGDALQALAFDLLAADAALDVAAVTRVDMLRTLAHACGSAGMAGGQAFDLAAVGMNLSAEELERMHVHKTGALIRASVRLGAQAAGCRDDAVLDALERYGHCIGLAFQIRDDILDVEGDDAQLGKTAGKDQVQGKNTYPRLLGMDGARAKLSALAAEMEAALAPLGDRPGGQADALRVLAGFAVARAS
jgi:farnesyl diphosphate synthase